MDLDQVIIAEPDTPSLQQTIERDEMSGCVQRYLNHLSDSYRAVILLHDMHELTASEIAQLLSESLATVKIRLHRARQKLSIALKAGCEFSHDERDVLRASRRIDPLPISAADSPKFTPRSQSIKTNRVYPFL